MQMNKENLTNSVTGKVDGRMVLLHSEGLIETVDESSGILCEDHLKISDPESGEIQFEGRG